LISSAGAGPEPWPEFEGHSPWDPSRRCPRPPTLWASHHHVFRDACSYVLAKTWRTKAVGRSFTTVPKLGGNIPAHTRRFVPVSPRIPRKHRHVAPDPSASTISLHRRPRMFSVDHSGEKSRRRTCRWAFFRYPSPIEQFPCRSRQCPSYVSEGAKSREGSEGAN